jgi:hypothetical protein
MKNEHKDAQNKFNKTKKPTVFLLNNLPKIPGAIAALSKKKNTNIYILF